MFCGKPASPFFIGITFLVLSSLVDSAVVARAEAGELHCNTGSKAILSDCQDLTRDKASWRAASPGTGNVQNFDNNVMYDVTVKNEPAYMIAEKGGCFVYATGPEITEAALKDEQFETLRVEAAALLGCSGDKKKVSAMRNLPRHSICVSADAGAKGCFSGKDWAGNEYVEHY